MRDEIEKLPLRKFELESPSSSLPSASLPTKHIPTCYLSTVKPVYSDHPPSEPKFVTAVDTWSLCYENLKNGTQIWWSLF